MPNFKFTIIKNKIRVYSDNILLCWVKKYSKYLKIPHNCNINIILIYQGWDDKNKKIYGITMRWNEFSRPKLNLDIKSSERKIITGLLNNCVKNGIYIIRVSSKMLKSEIQAIYTIFHELRHVQQYCFKQDAYDFIQNQISNPNRSYSQKKFEKDAIIYARNKLKKASFSVKEISKLINEIYHKYASCLMKSSSITLEKVYDDAKSSVLPGYNT